MSSGAAPGPSHIQVRGAREHNLRDVDLDIPRDKLVVITGLSGSGKSSLAFDTLYAEGQRRYVESLSAYARQFLDQMSKPDVDAVEGLSPALSIEQGTTTRSPRSTVGTLTEIYDHLRLLYARAGRPHCWKCDQELESQSVQQMTDRVLELPEGTTVSVFAPVVRGRKGVYKKELESFRRKGFVRVRVDGELLDLADDISLSKTRTHDIDVLVDRLVVREKARARITESIETALGLGDDQLLVEGGEDGVRLRLSASSACGTCGISFPEMAPRLFSFNSPHGACPRCSGLGTHDAFDPERVVPDPDKTLGQGAIAPWGSGRRMTRYYRQLLESLAAHLDIELDTPWRELPARARKAILNGTGKTEIEMVFQRRRRRAVTMRRPFDGVMGDLERRRREGGHDELARYTSAGPCPDCGGARLREEARSVRVGGMPLHELAALPISDAAQFLEALSLRATERAVAERIQREIQERLRFLIEVGLGYLTLDRRSATLSGGEGQRIRLATQVGASLLGVLYILDEPSIGLHARDHERLLASLERLRDAGNSVVVVEHDESTVRRADWVVDMGPAAGIHGGQVIAQGTVEEIIAHDASVTGAYLSGQRAIAVPARRPHDASRKLDLVGCSEHNLKDVTAEIPLGLLTVVTGVSGSGKSTLVVDTLHRALAQRLHRAEVTPGRFASLVGSDALDKVVQIDQAPIGRTPRSNAATYTGVFDSIRKMLAQVPEARIRGYGPGRFSFNVKGGRCEACQGDGSIRVEMHFLPDLWVTCEVCGGRRYNRETLEVRFKDHTVADILDASVEEALDLFEAPAVRRPLETLRDVGLGYLHLGQPATLLSGGEAQRIKLSRELAKRSSGRTLYILDEPTTGLHLADVERLLSVLHQLVERGNTVVVIEHHLDVIKCADHVIDLGPEGGEAGGEIVIAGTPEEVARCARSHTGQALGPLLRSAGAA